MQYIANGEYPRYAGDLRLIDENWKAGDALPDGWHEVLETDIPVVAENQKLVELEPSKNGENYYRAWEVVDMTPDEIDQRNIRTQIAVALGKAGFTITDVLEEMRY